MMKMILTQICEEPRGAGSSTQIWEYVFVSCVIPNQTFSDVTFHFKDLWIFNNDNNHQLQLYGQELVQKTACEIFLLQNWILSTQGQKLSGA